MQEKYAGNGVEEKIAWELKRVANLCGVTLQSDKYLENWWKSGLLDKQYIMISKILVLSTSMPFVAVLCKATKSSTSLHLPFPPPPLLPRADCSWFEGWYPPNVTCTSSFSGLSLLKEVQGEAVGFLTASASSFMPSIFALSDLPFLSFARCFTERVSKSKSCIKVG